MVVQADPFRGIVDAEKLRGNQRVESHPEVNLLEQSSKIQKKEPKIATF